MTLIDSAPEIPELFCFGTTNSRTCEYSGAICYRVGDNSFICNGTAALSTAEIFRDVVNSILFTATPNPDGTLIISNISMIAGKAVTEFQPCTGYIANTPDAVGTAHLLMLAWHLMTNQTLRGANFTAKHAMTAAQYWTEQTHSYVVQETLENLLAHPNLENINALYTLSRGASINSALILASIEKMGWGALDTVADMAWGTAKALAYHIGLTAYKL